MIWLVIFLPWIVMAGTWLALIESVNGVDFEKF